MIPTPGQPDKYYGIGAVNYHTGETVVQFHRRKRREEIAQLLEALVEKHSTGTVYVAWDNAGTHEDDAGGSRGTSSSRTSGFALFADLQPVAQPQ
jgi:hypothetical protein